MERYEERKIRNKDVILLQKVKGIMCEVVSLEKRRRFSEEQMYILTRRITGMPGRKGGTPSGFESAYAEMDAHADKYREQIKEYMHTLKLAENMLNEIPSITMRAFVAMMYLDDVPLVEIRTELSMTEYAINKARRVIEESADMKEAASKWKEKYIRGE